MDYEPKDYGEDGRYCAGISKESSSLLGNVEFFDTPSAFFTKF